MYPVILVLFNLICKHYFFDTYFIGDNGAEIMSQTAI
jgi:hypothetical protein